MLFLVMAAMVSFVLSPSSSQSTTGSIVVAVADPSGTVIPKIALILTQVDTGAAD